MISPDKAANAHAKRAEAAARTRRVTRLAVCSLLGLALVLGGGGREWPLPESALESLAAIVVAAWLWAAGWRTLKKTPAAAWLLALLLVLIPAVQLVPLPSSLWQALPGRATEHGAIDALGLAAGWRPWTISPGLTAAELLAATVPALLVLMVSHLPRRSRWIVPATIAAVGLLSLALGALQMISPLDGPLRFYAPKSNWLHGFQANRNSQADVLAISIVALAALAREALRRRHIGEALALRLFASLAALLAFGTALTASRTGFILLAVALGAAAGMLWTECRSYFARGRSRLPVALGLSASFAALAFAIAPLGRLAARFNFADEPRPEIWRDSIRTVLNYWPFGSGAGTFVPAFGQFEHRLPAGPFPIQHAHNEILEFMIEGGAFSLAAWTAIAVILFRNTVSSLKFGDPALRSSALFALGAISIVALHSLVDYPLRSLSLACVMGACTGLVINPTNSRTGAMNREGNAR